MQISHTAWHPSSVAELITSTDGPLPCGDVDVMRQLSYAPDHDWPRVNDLQGRIDRQLLTLVEVHVELYGGGRHDYQAGPRSLACLDSTGCRHAPVSLALLALLMKDPTKQPPPLDLKKIKDFT